MKDASNMTAQQIADKSSVPVATVNRVLQGLTENPGFDTVCKLVKAMGGSLNNLDEDRVCEPEGLTQLYERGLEYRNKKIRRLERTITIIAVFTFLVMAAVIGMLVYDMMYLDRGWITGLIK
nr:MAG TPA: LAMBDA REPRESSOR (TRIPLE MUTANT)/DNA COMPLEX-DNA COMPLEX, DOUBLE HELIX, TRANSCRIPTION-DNA.1A [Caudoviricetes sp.]